jgi:hypothetical protein
VALQPTLLLAGYLGQDPTFRSIFETLRVEDAEPERIEEAMKDYLPWAGRPRRFLVSFLERALDSPPATDPALCLFAASTVGVPAEATDRRWRRAGQRLHDGAHVLLAVGSGRCARPGCEVDVSDRASRYCERHEPEEVLSSPETLARVDRRSTSALLNAAADGLGFP